MPTTLTPKPSSEPPDPPSTPTSTTMNSLITLQVGERRFTTRANTLKDGSPFFTSLLSGQWGDAQPDNTYFIDSDPTVFEHILRYLRSNILPLFYDRSKGHDYALYTAVLEQARYFQIAKLETWIGEKRYLEAVKVQREARVEDGMDGIHEMGGADMEVELHPRWKTKKVYVCPRRIDIHRGDPSRCGKMCRIAQGEADDDFVDEEVLGSVLVVRKKIVFNQQMCFEG